LLAAAKDAHFRSNLKLKTGDAENVSIAPYRIGLISTIRGNPVFSVRGFPYFSDKEHPQHIEVNVGH